MNKQMRDALILMQYVEEMHAWFCADLAERLFQEDEITLRELTSVYRDMHVILDERDAVAGN